VGDGQGCQVVGLVGGEGLGQSCGDQVVSGGVLRAEASEDYFFHDLGDEVELLRPLHQFTQTLRTPRRLIPTQVLHILRVTRQKPVLVQPLDSHVLRNFLRRRVEGETVGGEDVSEDEGEGEAGTGADRSVVGRDAEQVSGGGVGGALVCVVGQEAGEGGEVHVRVEGRGVLGFGRD